MNRQKFNGKELQTTGNTGFLDYGARMYDDAIARWSVVDPMAEKYSSISPYTYVANNPLRHIDPDGRIIVDAKGNPITYSAKSGWSSNVTADVRRIGNAMMVTPKGSEMFNKMMNSGNNITITIDPGVGDGTKNGYTKSTRSGNEIGNANIVLYRGIAEGTVEKFKELKAGLEKGGLLNKTPDAIQQALLDNVPQNADEFMAGVAAHEAEHATNKAANKNFESDDLKREAIADKTRIEVINQTPKYRLENTVQLPSAIKPLN